CTKGAFSMAFAIRDLSVLAYANGFTLWHYRAGKEQLEGVCASGFFTDAADMLATGDIMMVSAADGARVLCVAGSANHNDPGTRSSSVTLARLA
ncbi:MAG: hypothetical protein ACREFY_14815, partial [Acetobacteraceae bacterium]